MNALLTNAMRLQAQRAASSFVSCRIGLVQSYDPAHYLAKVALQPDGTVTGWLKIAAHWVGNGWGLFSPPSIGEQVHVVFFGDLNNGFIESRAFTIEDAALNVPSGEWWLVHKNGQFVKLTNDGKLTVSDGHGATIQLDGAGNIVSQANQWTHTGPVTIDGNVAINGNETVSGFITAQGEVTGNGITLSTHVHGGVQSGGSTTAGPQG